YWNGYYLDPTIPVESRPYSLFRYSYDNGNSWRWSTMGQTWEHYTMMSAESRTSYICYPILTPDPNRDTIANPYHYPWDTVGTDTTHVDTTHNGISAQLLERYINVYPTVTDGGTVTVLSSFHLEGVEVYDAAGRMLSRQPASGVATTVDVSQLPAGSYVLRVNTVSGSTAKKFLKR
ncbi:MAG: T9SS type A sorting domain-containing protein, partial [Bacteroidales bacterium]|nr:T9SS type A sorting domain-containing protein [Bacteroidales bacterium]